MTELRGVIKARGIRFSGPFLFVTFIIMALGRKFFERSTLWVAKSILGKKLVRIYRGRRVEGIITETEAYVGPEDRASHASRGKTKRTEAMFGEAGTVYVYLIYGMHYCLNIVTDKKEYPAFPKIWNLDRRPVGASPAPIENRGGKKNRRGLRRQKMGRQTLEVFYKSLIFYRHLAIVIANFFWRWL